MQVQLTETAISKAAKQAAASGARVEVIDAAQEGLRLRVSPNGGRAWYLCCRDHMRRMRRYPLGKHPAVGISAAREAARALRLEVGKGADPVAVRRRNAAITKDAREGVGTLAALLDLYGKQQGKHLKTWDECRRRIESVFAKHLKRPLPVLLATDLQLTADGWPAQHSAAAGVRYLRPVLKWAVQRRYVPADLAAITPPATVGRRDRVLSREELAALLPALTADNRPYAAALRFMLLTLARREEACSATWRDIDFSAETWTISETKNGQPHVVPLSRQAVALLRSRLPAEGKPDPAGLIFATGTGKALANWDRETKTIMEATATEGWHRHDLRRTGATMLGEMGELPDIIEAALNHTAIRSTLAATYNRSRYRPQVAAALQRLADALAGIEAGAGAVIPMRRLAAE